MWRNQHNGSFSKCFDIARKWSRCWDADETDTRHQQRRMPRSRAINRAAPVQREYCIHYLNSTTRPGAPVSVHIDNGVSTSVTSIRALRSSTFVVVPVVARDCFMQQIYRTDYAMLLLRSALHGYMYGARLWNSLPSYISHEHKRKLRSFFVLTDCGSLWLLLFLMHVKNILILTKLLVGIRGIRA